MRTMGLDSFTAESICGQQDDKVAAVVKMLQSDTNKDAATAQVRGGGCGARACLPSSACSAWGWATAMATTTEPRVLCMALGETRSR